MKMGDALRISFAYRVFRRNAQMPNGANRRCRFTKQKALAQFGTGVFFSTLHCYGFPR